MSRKKTFTNNPTELFITPHEAPAPEPQTPVEGFTVPTGYRLVREKRDRRLQLLVSSLIADNLKADAETKGLSLNELCNRIFETYLKGNAEI